MQVTPWGENSPSEGQRGTHRPECGRGQKKEPKGVSHIQQSLYWIYKQGGVWAGFSVGEIFWGFHGNSMQRFTSRWSSRCLLLPSPEWHASVFWEAGCAGLSCKEVSYSARLHRNCGKIFQLIFQELTSCLAPPCQKLKLDHAFEIHPFGGSLLLYPL